MTGNVETRTQLPVYYPVVTHVLFAGGSPQKMGVIPEHRMPIKSVKGVSCVDLLSSVQNATNAPLVVSNPPVGSRLHEFWEKWAALGVSPKVISVFKEGYILPFRSRPYLTRKPTITSCYVDPHRNSYLLEALHQLLDKNALELVQNPQSLGFYNRLFLVPKPNNRWRPILDLSKLNNYLKTQSFKMETPETIRTSLEAGEWVTSIDFKYAYFHIPINSQSRKYMHFHIQDKTYQFKALPFGLSTAPMEFTLIAKEVKWIAMRKGIRIHQYIDDWLVRATSHQACLQQTQTLVALCRELGWLVNEKKSELEPKPIFNFVGYQFNLRGGRVRPTTERWQTLQVKIREILSNPLCPVRNLMSLIGLLTATEKQVHLGRLHMRPIQWHLKNNWRAPETLEKNIPKLRTSDLRQNKELVFVSFKKGFDKDISPATVSSWIKQTVILCYELSDQQVLTLHQVKAHDVRAFAASKAFQSGISLDQILSACHWKSHNTFTQFYLKDVAWADSELIHLGLVVAAQQIHQQAQ